MNKILLVLQREYLVRVRKRTFLIMTFLTPVLLAALMVIPIFLIRSFENEKTIGVIDESGKILGLLEDFSKLKFVESKEKDYQKAKENLKESGNYAILYIPKLDIKKISQDEIKLTAEKTVPIDTKQDVKNAIDKAVESILYTNAGIKKEVLEEIESDVVLDTSNIKGEESSSVAAFAVGFLVAFLIYMSVFLYGQQVMRGVIEEKSNRIIEVIVSSVKPFQLMMGKILGVGLIGVTQFVLWILLTVGIFMVASNMLDLDKYAQAQTTEMQEQLKRSNPDAKEVDLNENPELQKAYQGLMNFPFTLVIGSFMFYFLAGYLLYSSMFAAVASAVDNEADTQQFVLPVSLPLIIAFIAFQAVIKDPDGTIAFWMSMIPFTSPIIMMVRLPFGGVAAWELILSMVLLVATFIAMTWVAARIYRIGILMYGKKPSFKDLGKWVFYKL